MHWYKKIKKNNQRARYKGQTAGDENRPQSDLLDEKISDNEIAEGNEVRKIKELFKSNQHTKLNQYIEKLKEEGFSDNRIQSMISRAMYGIRMSGSDKKIKISQDISQTEENINSPNINIQPYEPLIQEAVNELKSEQPGLLKNVTDINVDIGYGQFGSVSNQSPNTININLEKIKFEIAQQTGQGFNESDPQQREQLKHHIKEIIIHEQAHVSDYDPETGNFPGGENVAERAQEAWVRSYPYA